MTHIDSGDGAAVLVRAADAEVIGFPPQTVRLLADSSATGGRLSTQRVTLAGGADGASPHHHATSAELFYVLSGSAQLLAGDRLLVAGEGDLALVSPGLPHAFAAAQASDADLLIVITPGVERFEYFRHLARIATRGSPRSLLEVQARYDTFFDDSPAWRRARAPAGRVCQASQASPATRHLGGFGERVRNHRRYHRCPGRRDHLRHRCLLRPRAAAGACPARRHHHGCGHGPCAPIWRPEAARPGVIGILAAAAATSAAAVSGSPASATAAGIALIATLIWLGLYLRVAAPINQALTAAAIAHVTPGNARALQSRWDSIIATRALLMAAAVAGLAVSAAAH